MTFVRYLVMFAVNVLAVYLTTILLSGVRIDGLLALILTAAVLGLINTILRPILIFLTLPVAILTLGLFILVINAGLVLLANVIVTGFVVDNFWWALLFSLVLALVGGLLGMLIKPKKN